MSGKISRYFMRSFLFNCLFLINLILGQTLPEVDIGIVMDGPWDLNLQVVSTFKEEIQDLTQNEFNVRFPEDKMIVADWTQDGILTAFRKLLNDPAVDIIIAGGVISSQEVTKLAQLAKPVLAPVILDPELQDLPLMNGTSGRKNLSYTHSPARIVREIEYFREIVPFKKLVIFSSRVFIETIPQFHKNIKILADEMNLEVHSILVDTSASRAISQLPEDAEAVFLGTLFQMPESELRKLIEEINERKLPSFALWGKPDVERGVLAGLLPDTYLPRLARRTALNIQRILLGEKPEDLPVAFAPEERLVINLETARRIGVYPNWAVLTEAELLNPVRETAPRQLTLRDVMMEAMEVNLALQASERGVIAGAENINIARSNLLPQIDISATGLQIDKDRAEASFGSQAERTISGSATATQLLFSQGAWANYSIQKSIQKSRMFENEGLRLDIVLEAGLAYLGVLRSKTFERIQRENLRITRENLELAQIRLSVGFSGQSEVYRWEAQIAANRIDVIFANSQRNLAEIELNRILNRPLEENFDILDNDLSDAALFKRFSRLFQYMNNPLKFKVLRNFMAQEGIAKSPEIKTIDAAIKAQERFLKSTRDAIWIPTLALQGDVYHRFSEEGAGAGQEATGMFPIEIPSRDDTDWSIAINASLDLFRGGSKLAEKQQALEELSQLKLERSELVNRIEQRVRSAFHRAGASFAAIEQSRKAADASMNNLELVRESYRQGALSIIELLDAQNAARLSDETASNAVYDFLIDLLNVQRAIGTFDIFQSDSERDQFYDRLDAHFEKIKG
jgi:outer membrane protein TolC/ABC-type uncharacterized transport system substrate-binding protein